MTVSAPIRVRTQLEAELYLDVHGARGPRSERRVGAHLEVNAQDAQGRPQAYTFELTQPDHAGFGAGRSECFEAIELWEHAETLSARVPAAVSGMSEAQLEILRRVLAIAAQVLAFYEPGQSLPVVRTARAREAQTARPLRLRRDSIEAAIISWRNLFEAASAAHGVAEANAGTHGSRQAAIEARFDADHALYTATANHALLARVLLQRGRAYENAAFYDLAERDFVRALELFRALSDVPGEASALVRAAGLAANRGDLRAAQSLYDAARERYAAANEVQGEADALWGRGALWSLGRDFDAADDDLNEALQRYHQVGSTDGIASVLFERAKLRTRRGLDPAGADWDYREAARIFGERGDARREQVLRAQRTAAGAPADPALDPIEHARSLKARAKSKAASGDFAGALVDANEALALFERLDAPVARANTLADRAKLHHAAQNLDAAAADLDAAFALYTAQGAELGRGNVYEARGDLARQRGSLDAARSEYQRALEVYERLGIPSGQANTHAELARVALAMHDHEIARRHAERASELGARGVSSYAEAAAREVLSSLAEH